MWDITIRGGGGAKILSWHKKCNRKIQQQKNRGETKNPILKKSPKKSKHLDGKSPTKKS
jgi:hypothetical protein